MVIDILQAVCGIFQSIELGAAIVVTLLFKDTPRNKAALGGLVPWQWPNE